MSEELLKRSLEQGIAEAANWQPELPFPTEPLDFVQWHDALSGNMLYIEVALVDQLHGSKLFDLATEEERKDWVHTRDGIGYKMLKCLKQMMPIKPRVIFGGAFANRQDVPFRFGIFGHDRCYVFRPRWHLEGQ